MLPLADTRKGRVIEELLLGSFLCPSPQDAEKFLQVQSIVLTLLASGSDDKSVVCLPSRVGRGP